MGECNDSLMKLTFSRFNNRLLIELSSMPSSLPYQTLVRDWKWSESRENEHLLNCESYFRISLVKTIVQERVCLSWGR